MTDSERWEQRLAWPVLLAALATVPAVFLTLLEDPYSTVGQAGLWLTGAVMIAETAILWLTSPQKLAWIRRNWWLIGLTIMVIVGVIFAIGPVQILRLVRAVGALRVLRAKRIIKAGRALRRVGPSRWWQRIGTALATGVVAAFVAVILADPTSDSRALIERLVGEQLAAVATVLAGVILFAATFLLIRRRANSDDDEANSADESDGSDRAHPASATTDPTAGA